MSSNRDLTPKKAYDHFNNDGMTNGQIAEKYDVSEATVRRRRKTFREQKEVMEDITENKLQSYDPSEAITDDEPEDNPYSMITCPNCGEDFDPPEEPQQMDCPGCKITLQIEESDLE